MNMFVSSRSFCGGKLQIGTQPAARITIVSTVDIVSASKSVLQDPDAITGSSLPRKACTQLTRGPFGGSFTSMASKPPQMNRGVPKVGAATLRAAADGPHQHFGVASESGALHPTRYCAVSANVFKKPIVDSTQLSPNRWDQSLEHEHASVACLKMPCRLPIYVFVWL